jgi:hypothetical protein
VREINVINRYFVSSILILIDEMNMELESLSSSERVNFSRKKFSEADFAIRLGSPFRQFARYPMQGFQGQDIIVDYNDLEVEVKYWRNWEGGTGKQKAAWNDAYKSAFDWLVDEINRGRISGWFTFFDWKDLLQLGRTTGPNPKINLEKIKKLPFLRFDGERVNSVRTNYSLKVGQKLYNDILINYEVFGSEHDLFNVVILY